MQQPPRFPFPLLFLVVVCRPLSAQEPGLILNEFSNGTDGTKEFYELVVTGPACSFADIRGWIIDDNNGDFSGGPAPGMGITSGHIRFADVPEWSEIPVGAIILIYNDSDKNTNITLADDPTDSNNDSVYVVPVNYPGLERCNTLPGTSDSRYTPCTFNPAAWTPIWLRNAGDAAQVRRPDGTYFHGVSYGENQDGGPDGIHLAGEGTGKTGYFTNQSSDDYRDPSNWTTGTAGTAEETPGYANTEANRKWITGDLKCVLPVTLLTFDASVTGNEVVLQWTTATETDHASFHLERSCDGSAFTPLTTIYGSGQSTVQKAYTFTDTSPQGHLCYYRLRQTDTDGTTRYSPPVAVTFDTPVIRVYPNPARDFLTIQAPDHNGEIHAILHNMMGEAVRTAHVAKSPFTIDLTGLPPAGYLLTVQEATGKWIKRQRIVIDK